VNHVPPSINCNDPVPQSHYNQVDGVAGCDVNFSAGIPLLFAFFENTTKL
jgi:hypothetical protein